MVKHKESLVSTPSQTPRLVPDLYAYRGLAIGLNASGTEIHQVYWQQNDKQELYRLSLARVSEAGQVAVRAAYYSKSGSHIKKYDHDIMGRVETNNNQHHIITSTNFMDQIAQLYENGKGGLAPIQNELHRQYGENSSLQLTAVVNMGSSRWNYPCPDDFDDVVMVNMVSLPERIDPTQEPIGFIRPYVNNLRYSVQPGKALALTAMCNSQLRQTDTPQPFKVTLGETIEETAQIYQQILATHSLAAIAVKSIGLDSQAGYPVDAIVTHTHNADAMVG